jgi:cytochrome c oxidase cbb3-type subunit 2
MNYGPLIFLGAFFALATSWFGFVLTPQYQIGQLQQTNSVPGNSTYPLARSGMARQGLEAYRANGCAACHSQQVRQTGVNCNIVLTDTGTNHTKLISALKEILPSQPDSEIRLMLTGLPKTILRGVNRGEADAASKLLKAATAKSEIHIVPVGVDIARGWGKRQSVAEDFLYDSPVLLGMQRVGPDLADVGARYPDVNWHLRHLYDPRSEVKGSVMPSYKFLFEKRRIPGKPSPDALALPADAKIESGYEIVPKTEARELAAYLASLQSDVSLFNAPFSSPAVAVPATTNAAAISNTPTNEPAK